MHTIMITLVPMKIGVSEIGYPLSQVNLISRMPITDLLTEAALGENMEEMDAAELLTLAVIRQELTR
jgi:hypothetical protein